jgi:TPR repeat protein
MSTQEDILHYKDLAEKGDTVAQFRLGWVYRNGKGVPPDDVEAMKWYRKAAEQGNTDAQNNLGAMYQNGKGVSQNIAEAVMWYTVSAGQGNAGAQTNLGAMYEDGKGVPQSDAEAVKWYRKAAEQGNGAAQFRLGWMYQNGRGVPQDDTEALKWYNKAAEQGDTAAQKNLDQMKVESNKADMTESKALFTKEIPAQKFTNQGESKAQWWYADKSINNGPVEADELKKLLQIGKINLKTLVWQERMVAWRPLDEVEELSSLKASVPPPLPPKFDPRPSNYHQATHSPIPGLVKSPGSSGPLFLHVSVSRLIILSIVSFGIL